MIPIIRVLHVHVCSRRERVFAYAICIHACTISLYPSHPFLLLLPVPCAPSGSLRVYVAMSLARLVNSSGHHACSRVSHDDAGSILLKSSRFDSFRRARFQCFLMVTSAGKRDPAMLILDVTRTLRKMFNTVRFKRLQLIIVSILVAHCK